MEEFTQLMKCGDHHMQLNNSKRENADPHHGEADHAVPNFAQQETLQRHQRNKSWNCALEITQQESIQCLQKFAWNLQLLRYFAWIDQRANSLTKEPKIQLGES